MAAPAARRHQRPDIGDEDFIPRPDGSDAPEISVVIPVLNEAQNVGEMCRQLRAVLEPLGYPFEVIFVGGGSHDSTEEIVLTERTADPRIKLLWLSRNFGHQEALTAGLDYARGEAVITMDGDLQHPPSLLPVLIERWKEGYDVVTTIRLSTADAGFLKRVTSRWFYAMLNRVSNLELEEGSADFRLLSRSVVDAIRAMPERARFLRGMVHWVGFVQTRVPYHAAQREAGHSKYSVLRLLRFALLATVSFSAIPLYLLALLGFTVAGLSFLYGVFAIVAKFLADVPIEGWASLLAGVMFIGGLNLASLGLLGVYIAKIFDEAKARPVYLVREAHGFGRSTATVSDRVSRADVDYHG